MWRIYVGLGLAVLLLIAGGFAGAKWFGGDSPPSFLTVVNEMREDVRLVHERDVSTYYHVCPERDEKFSLLGVINRPPKLFMVVPATLRFKVPLEEDSVTQRETGYVVNLGAITVEQPTFDSATLQAVVTEKKAGTAEERYVDREKSRATALLTYMSLIQLKSDVERIRSRMTTELLPVMRGLLLAAEEPDARLSIEWDNGAQAEYIDARMEGLAEQPPFGIRGCEDDADRPQGFVTNGVRWFMDVS